MRRKVPVPMDFLIFVMLWAMCNGARIDFVYHKHALCDLSDRESLDCSIQHIDEARTMLECCAHCNLDRNCIGASTDQDGVCFIHNHCPTLSECTVENTDHKFFSKQCANGGEYQPSSMTCQCVDTWVGHLCDERARDCQELFGYGYTESFYKTLLDIEKDGENLINGYCNILATTGYTNLGILYNTGMMNFNVSWNEFQNGFYIDDKNYWIGLNAWQALSGIGYQQPFIVLDFGEEGNLYRFYNDFIVEDESQDYQFTHGSSNENGRGNVIHSNKLLDCFGPFQNTPFSTWDHDNDQSGQANCASDGGSGWWYQGCNPTCNIFGWIDSYLSENGEDQQTSRMVIPGVNLEVIAGDLKAISMYATKV